MSKMFEPITKRQREQMQAHYDQIAEDDRRERAAEARLDTPVTRRELLDAIELVRNQFGGSGLPEQEAVYDAFDRLRDALQ